MWTLSATALQAGMSLVFLWALWRLESGRGILLAGSLDSSRAASGPQSARRSERVRRKKGLLRLLLLASALATLCDLSPIVEAWLR